VHTQQGIISLSFSLLAFLAAPLEASLSELYQHCTMKQVCIKINPTRLFRGPYTYNTSQNVREKQSQHNIHNIFIFAREVHRRQFLMNLLSPGALFAILALHATPYAHPPNFVTQLNLCSNKKLTFEYCAWRSELICCALRVLMIGERRGQRGATMRINV
jgi:hypothetical protein